MPIPRLAKTSQQGFSLLEAMVGFTIVSSLLAAMAPVILIAVGTRFQNYRAEQAMQLAQSQINRVQALMTQGVENTRNAGRVPPPAAAGIEVAEVDPPTTTVTTLTDLDSTTKALEIDYNHDNQPEFLVQLFRDQGVIFTEGAGENEMAVFQMGVRVYAGSAKDNLGNLSTEPATLNFTTGLGEQKIKPLAVLYTEVSRSDLTLSLQQYKEYLNQIR